MISPECLSAEAWGRLRSRPRMARMATNGACSCRTEARPIASVKRADERLSRAIQRLNRASESLNRANLGLSHADECLNRSVEWLKRTIQRLTLSFEGLLRAIQRLRRVVEWLRRAIQRLKRANQSPNQTLAHRIHAVDEVWSAKKRNPSFERPLTRPEDSHEFHKFSRMVFEIRDHSCDSWPLIWFVQKPLE